MWAKVAEEMKLPWRAVEAMHWQLGMAEMAGRAGVTPFSPVVVGADTGNGSGPEPGFEPNIRLPPIQATRNDGALPSLAALGLQNAGTSLMGGGSLAGPISRVTAINQGPKQETYEDSPSSAYRVWLTFPRLFVCLFSFAGCTAKYTTIGDWKCHTTQRHLRQHLYLCSCCPPPKRAHGKPKVFTMKGQFRRHLHQMHPHVCFEEMEASSLIAGKQPPHQLACAKPGCERRFEPRFGWKSWLDHVGQHMQDGEATQPGTDLIEWAQDSMLAVRGGREQVPGRLGIRV